MIGLVIGLLLPLCICCALGYIFLRKRHAREREREQTATITSSEVHIAGKGQAPGVVYTLDPPLTIPPPPPVTLAALSPAVPVATAAPAGSRSSRRVSRMSAANIRPTTPSSYFSSEFSEKSLFHYEPDPSIGIPVDYPIAIHVPPRVAKALAKRGAARLTNEQFERELAERAMYLPPGPSRITYASEGSSGSRNTDGHGSNLGFLPTGYNGNQARRESSMAESSNALSGGQPDVHSDPNRWSSASSRLFTSIPGHEVFPLPPEPSTPRSAVFRPSAMPGIASVLSGDPSDDRQRRISHPLPPIPQQQEDDTFQDNSASVVPDSSTQLHNPFNADRGRQGSMTTDESTNTAGGGLSQEAHLGAVTATARATPAARVVYSTASSGSHATDLVYNRSSGGSMIPVTAMGPDTDSNPFDDQHGFPMRSQVAYIGVATTAVDETINGHTMDQHDGSQSASQQSVTSASSAPPSPGTHATHRTFGQ